MLVDSGLVSWSRFSFLHSEPTEKPPQTQSESLQQYSSKIQKELGEVETALREQKSNLRSLQKELSTYEMNISRQKQNLKSSTKISLLSKSSKRRVMTRSY